jgi:hypothetical protein
MVRDPIVRHQALVWGAAVLAGWLLFGVSAVASAQGRRNGAGDVTVFADPGYRGASVTLRGPTPDLRDYRLNDKVSSIDIPPGESWEVCQDINYGNACVVFSNSVPDLRTFGWNDRMSSLRPVQGGFAGRGRNGNFASGGGSRRLVIYDRAGYRGASMAVTGDTRNLGSFGNRVGSVEVMGGAWELCDGAGARARCVTISDSVPDLSRTGLNGRVMSVRPIDGARGYGRGQGNQDYGR